MVNKGKKLEWNILFSKPSIIKIHYVKAADHIRESFAHRFMGKRFVLTRKACHEGEEVDPNEFDRFRRERSMVSAKSSEPAGPRDLDADDCKSSLACQLG